MQVDEIINVYDKYNLTPLFVVLGGSRSSNHNDGNLDYDYFGYHEELDSEPHQRLITNDGQVIKSISQNRIMNRLSGKDLVQASFEITNLLWHRVLFIEDKFNPFINSIRVQVQNNITSYVTLFRNAASLLVDGIMKNGGFDKTEKHWTRWLRILLTSWYLEDEHELNCDFVYLTQHYGLQLERLNNPDDVYNYRKEK